MFKLCFAGLTLLNLLVFTVNAISQHRADNWSFGALSGLNFDTSPPTPYPGCQINAAEGCSSISDTLGNLLFYSEGETVWDSTNSPMPNGTGLFGSVNSSQSALIVPKPGSNHEYFLFTSPAFNSPNPVAYSIVDMSLNNGNGDVTAVKNIPMLYNSCEKLTATQHSNGIDFWVVAHEYNSADFYAFLVTSSGVDTTPVISTPDEVTKKA